MKKVVDISEHNGDINWSIAKKEIDGVVLRVGYGQSTLDKYFEKNTTEARKANVSIPAVYHFSYALTPEDARIEAEFVIKQLERLNYDKNTIVYFDYEDDSIRYSKSKGVTPKVTDVISMGQLFVNAIRKAGFKAGIYANSEYYNKWFNKFINFTDIYFWYADWRKNPDNMLVSICDIHQYSSSGDVGGIKTRVDMNNWYDDRKKTTSEESKSTVSTILKSNDEIAKEVIDGKWGNGNERRTKLISAGYDYDAIQKVVNTMLGSSKPLKSNDEIAKEVIDGKWGNGNERRTKLISAGYDYDAIQKVVNGKLSTPSKVASAKSKDNQMTGTYEVAVNAVNIRYVPGVITEKNVVTLAYNGDTLQCYGYYTMIGNKKWLLIQFGNHTGFVDSQFVRRK